MSVTGARMDSGQLLSSHSLVSARNAAKAPSVWAMLVSPGCGQSSSLNTRIALSRRNLGQTASRNGTWGISEKMRSSDSPIGK